MSCNERPQPFWWCTQTHSNLFKGASAINRFAHRATDVFGNRNVLRTLSNVSNPLLVSQRDWVSADGAAFHTQPACSNPSCYRFPWHLERWHDMDVTQAGRHHLHSHSATKAAFTLCAVAQMFADLFFIFSERICLVCSGTVALPLLGLDQKLREKSKRLRLKPWREQLEKGRTSKCAWHTNILYLQCRIRDLMRSQLD